MKFYTYDLEVLPNYFLFCGKFKDNDKVYTFELSTRKNQRQELLDHLSYLQSLGVMMVGYNSLGYDYPMIHQLMTNPYKFTYITAYETSRNIINGQNFNGPNRYSVYLSDRIIPQLDLMKLNHFDNANKRVSLKALQFAMRSESVEDLPYPFDEPLTPEQMDEMEKYCIHDVTETESFLDHCLPAVKMRQELLNDGVIRGDVFNFSDVKIGQEYLINKIGRSTCYIKGSTPRQSTRYSVSFASVIQPNMQFRTDEYQPILDWFKSQTIDVNTKTRPKLETTLAGLQFHFGVGGVHASAESKVYESSDTHVVKDIDVTGMYVSVAVANGFHPEHLGQAFVNAYGSLKSDRAKYPKGTTMNATLKLAGNGVYGNSNNKYSCFFDPKYLYTVTVNGQISIMMLVEMLDLIPSLEVIQANTDGVTVYMRREVEPFFNMWCRQWEVLTKLNLEEVNYKRMWIRDVNNYLVETESGKIKAKGAYWYPKTQGDYEGQWHKDFSSMCVQKAIEPVLTHDYESQDAIKCVTNPFDFMLRYKTTRGAKVYVGDKEMPKTVRYYVSTQGQPMKKVSQPKGLIGAYKRRAKITDEYYASILSQIPDGAWDERIHTKNKSRYAQTTTSIQSGRLVKVCNKASDFTWDDVDWDYYTNEVDKLIIGDK